MGGGREGNRAGHLRVCPAFIILTALGDGGCHPVSPTMRQAQRPPCPPCQGFIQASRAWGPS